MKALAVIVGALILAGTLERADAHRTPSDPPPKVEHAIRLASTTYGMPYGEAVRVAYCESRWNARAKNPRSTATGLMQFLDSTWARTPYARLDRRDPYANALAAGWLWRANGGSWREWSCAWAA